MLRKEITYKDFDGNEITRPFYFNLTQAEWLEMEASAQGFQRMMERLMESRDMDAMLNTFKSLIIKGYGVRDGEDFVKTEDARRRFESSEAYSVLFMELFQDDKKAIEFLRAMLPQEMMKELPPLTAPEGFPVGATQPSVIPPPPMPTGTIEAGRQIAQDAGM